jgi:hypothetical protein
MELDKVSKEAGLSMNPRENKINDKWANNTNLLKWTVTGILARLYLPEPKLVFPQRF